MTPVFETVAVSVKAGARTLLDDTSLAFAAGQSVAFVGPNGAGKSTLLRVMAGELSPRGGCVRLRGQDLAAYRPDELASHRAVLSQRVIVTFPFTVAEVVRMGAGRRRGSRIDSLIDAVLAELDLSDLADRAVTRLSGGEQQRAHFARVLVQHACGQEGGGAGILLLDEPTASLDLRHQLALLDALARRAANGALVIAVLHDLNLAAMFAQRIVVLDSGRIDCDGPPHETITDAMLSRVFGVEIAMNAGRTQGAPCVLPQAMMAAKRPRPGN